MVIFISDDFQYRRWVAANTAGFVLACSYQTADRDYPVLHRSGCRSLASSKNAGKTGKDFYKACAVDVEELEKYAQIKFARMVVCPVCSPYGEIVLR